LGLELPFTLSGKLGFYVKYMIYNTQHQHMQKKSYEYYTPVCVKTLIICIIQIESDTVRTYVKKTNLGKAVGLCGPSNTLFPSVSVNK
jgi:hypothetical protein